MSPVGFLCGLTVHQVRVRYDVRLVASDATRLDENEVEIVMEGPCIVTDSGGAEHRVQLSDPESIPALFKLQSRIIRAASAEGGTLRAALDDGSTFAIPPLGAYEAWRIEGHGGDLVICMPGGELSWRLAD